MTVFTSSSQNDTSKTNKEDFNTIFRNCYKDALRLDSCINYSSYQDSILNTVEGANKDLKQALNKSEGNNTRKDLLLKSKEERIKQKEKENKKLKGDKKKIGLLGGIGWVLLFIAII